MIVSLAHLKTLLLTNVCEVRFMRRREIDGRSDFRRMWCTNSFDLLNSFNGKVVLNYRQPIFRLPYNPDEYNLIVTWDIFMGDFRQINMDNCDLIQSIVANDSFWEYFNNNLLPMT